MVFRSSLFPEHAEQAKTNFVEMQIVLTWNKSPIISQLPHGTTHFMLSCHMDYLKQVKKPRHGTFCGGNSFRLSGFRYIPRVAISRSVTCKQTSGNALAFCKQSL